MVQEQQNSSLLSNNFIIFNINNDTTEIIDNQNIIIPKDDVTSICDFKNL